MTPLRIEHLIGFLLPTMGVFFAPIWKVLCKPKRAGNEDWFLVFELLVAALTNEKLC